MGVLDNPCLAAPFLILPYFERAKAKMTLLLSESLDMFHRDCIDIITSFIFMRQPLYNRQCHQKDHEAAKCIVLLQMLSSKWKRLYPPTNEPRYHQIIFENDHKNMDAIMQMNGYYDKNFDFWQRVFY